MGSSLIVRVSRDIPSLPLSTLISLPVARRRPHGAAFMADGYYGVETIHLSSAQE